MSLLSSKSVAHTAWMDEWMDSLLDRALYISIMYIMSSCDLTVYGDNHDHDIQPHGLRVALLTTYYWYLLTLLQEWFCSHLNELTLGTLRTQTGRPQPTEIEGGVHHHSPCCLYYYYLLRTSIIVLVSMKEEEE